ncbi:MAG: hypothetical protein Tsb006_3210 [Rickettsiaceae bacterium]
MVFAMRKNVLYLMISLSLLCFTNLYALATESTQPQSTSENQEQATTDTNEQNQEEQKTTLQITDVWARKSMAPNNNSAAYMKISNPTKQQITIIGASASMVANNVELHKSFVDEKGVSRMTSVDKIIVPAESAVELAPGGLHVMLFDLKRNLSEGDKFKITIKVEEMEPIIVESIVK